VTRGRGKRRTFEPLELSIDRPLPLPQLTEADQTLAMVARDARARLEPPLTKRRDDVIAL
jgi:hypothetical protein